MTTMYRYANTIASLPVSPAITPQKGQYILHDLASYEIHDRADDKLPIRQLQQHGEDSLSTSDLLQVALGESDSLKPIIKEYGIELLASLRTVPQIVETLGIDHLKATRLLAILSLGRRVFREPQAGYPVIRGIDDIFRRYRSLGSLGREQLMIALVNSRYLLVHDEVLAVGSAQIVRISPFEVFHPAILRQIHSVILIHNHATGDPTPSEADISFTARMLAAARIMDVDLLDHVIIGSEGYSSALPPGS